MIAPLLLETDEIKTRDDDDIICDSTLLSKKSVFYTLGAPLADEFSLSVPVTMLIPHIKCQTNNSSASMHHIIHIIENLSLCSARKTAERAKREAKRANAGSQLQQHGAASLARRGTGAEAANL